MFIYDYLQEKHVQGQSPWPADHPKSVYVITQVLVHFGIYCEDDIPEDQDKYAVTDLILDLAIEEDLLEERSEEKGNPLKDEIKSGIRSLYDFMSPEDLTPVENAHVNQQREVEFSEEKL